MLFPAFSRIAADAARFRETFLRALGLIWCSSVPVAGLLVALGQPAVVVLLGEQWRGAGIAVVAMAGFGPGVAMSSVGAEAIKGAGRSHLVNWLTLTSVVVGIGLLWVLLPLGLFGVGLAISVDSLLVGSLALLLARQVVEVSVADLAGCLIPPLVATVATTVAIGALEHMIVHSDTYSIPLGVALLFGQTLAFGGLFGGGKSVSAPARSRALAESVRKFVRPA